MELKIGTTATAIAVVGNKNTAKAVGSGDLDVFGTPMMIALMEEAACNCLKGFLDATQSSVGTQVNIAHTAASPVGANITATAVMISAEGRKVEFSVSARDEVNEIGNGTHTRVIIDKEKFMSRLTQKM